MKKIICISGMSLSGKDAAINHLSSNLRGSCGVIHVGGLVRLIGKTGLDLKNSKELSKLLITKIKDSLRINDTIIVNGIREECLLFSVIDEFAFNSHLFFIYINSSFISKLSRLKKRRISFIPFLFKTIEDKLIGVSNLMSGTAIQGGNVFIIENNDSIISFYDKLNELVVTIKGGGELDWLN